MHSSVRQLGAGSESVGSPDRFGSGRSTPNSSLSPLALFLPDLSFNNIEAIEGLDTLVNLEDLSLFNNRISKIDSLDALVKLQVLSLGNNQIGNMMNVSELSPGRGWGWGWGLCQRETQGQSFRSSPFPREARDAAYFTRDAVMFKQHASPRKAICGCQCVPCLGGASFFPRAPGSLKKPLLRQGPARRDIGLCSVDTETRKAQSLRDARHTST